MRGLALPLLAAGLAGAARAETVAADPLPPPDHADTEVSEDIPLPAWNENVRKFLFTLEFQATPSNNVQAVFGKDADGDGALSDGEAGMAVGWDCGGWFIRLFPDSGPGVGTNIAAAAGHKALSFEMRLKKGDEEGGVPDIRCGGAALFTELAAGQSARMHDRSWDRVRLTARGVGRPEERFEAARSPDGLSIIFR